MSSVFRNLGLSSHAEQVRRAGEAARHYAALGLKSIPSRKDEKRPALGSYRRWLDEPIPDEWLYRWSWPNVQVVMGVRCGICCIDIDGEDGLRSWWDIVPGGLSSIRKGDWMSGSPVIVRDKCSLVSRHYFFRVPMNSCGGPDRLPTTTIWKGSGHNEVRLIGDRGLVVMPPSVHPEPGRGPHEWFSGGETLEGMPVLPESILLMVLRAREKSPPLPPVLGPLVSVPSSGFRTEEVLAALGDRKVDIARSHGLVTVGCGDPYLKCHVPWRDDREPSGSIDRRTGRVFDWTKGRGDADSSRSFFEVLSALDPGTYPDWRAARELMGRVALGGGRWRK